MGYSTDCPAYLIWNTTTKRLVRSQNVASDEHWTTESPQDHTAYTEFDPKEDGISTPRLAEQDVQLPEASVEEAGDDTEFVPTDRYSVSPDELNEMPGQGIMSQATLNDGHGRYPRWDRRPPPEWWIVQQAHPEAFSAMSTDPISYKDALRSIYADDWKQAIQAEYDTLIAQRVWDTYTLPPGKHSIGNEWAFKTKFNADGSICKYKARLVAEGYSQRYGTDYAEIFAPVLKMTSLRSILSMQYSKGGKSSKWT